MKTKLTFLFILVYSCIFSQKGKIAGFIYDKEKKYNSKCNNLL